MNEVEDIEERERLISLAESDSAFGAIALSLSELVDKEGLPEREIERVLSAQGINPDLIGLFRLYRTVAAVTKRLQRQPKRQEFDPEEVIAEYARQVAALKAERDREMQRARRQEYELMRNITQAERDNSDLLAATSQPDWLDRLKTGKW